jgi:hypothetical protein
MGHTAKIVPANQQGALVLHYSGSPFYTLGPVQDFASDGKGYTFIFAEDHVTMITQIFGQAGSRSEFVSAVSLSFEFTIVADIGDTYTMTLSGSATDINLDGLTNLSKTSS